MFKLSSDSSLSPTKSRTSVEPALVQRFGRLVFLARPIYSAFEKKSETVTEMKASFVTIRTTLILSDGQCPPSVMEKILDDKLDCLKCGLDYFDQKKLTAPPPLTNNKQPFELTESNVSSLIQLDQSFCKELIHSFQEENVTWSQWNDFELKEKFIQHYFEERSSIIEILCYLFFSAQDPEKVYHDLAREIIQNHFLDDVFTENIFDQFQRKSRSSVPQNFLATDMASIWAIQSVKEQKVLLDLLFIRYAVKSPEHSIHLLLLKFLQHSLNTRFGKDQPIEQFLDNIGREMVSQVHDLSQILIIIILFVEFKVDTILPSAPLHLKQTAPQKDIMVVNEIALKMGNDQTHGIFLWIWSSYLSHLQAFFDETSWPYDYQDLETIANNIVRDCGIKAFKLDVISNILRILKGSCFQPDEPYITGYKLVFKHFFMSIFEAYEVNHLVDYNGLIECFALVFGEYGPCQEFWEEDFDHPKRRSLLDLAITRFPQQFHPLMRLLIALASDEASAKYIFEFFQSLPVCCYSAAEYQLSTALNSAYIVYAKQPIKILENIYQKTITIPQGTCGNVVSLVNGEKIVRWKINYSAWQLFIGMLESFPLSEIEDISTDDDTRISRIREILQLINTMLINAPGLVEPMVEHLDSFKEMNEPNKDLSEIIFEVIKNVLDVSRISSGEIELVANGFKCLKALLPYFGKKIILYLKQSSLLPNESANDLMADDVQSIDQLQYLLMEKECVSGSYPVTIAFLDLVIGILSNVERDYLVVDQEIWTSPLEVLRSCVSYVLNVIFVSFDHWRYNNPLERVQIGSKCLEIFNRIMLGCPPVKGHIKYNDPMVCTKESDLQHSLKEYVASNFLTDGGLYHALPLFSIIEKGKESRYYLGKNSNYQMVQGSTNLLELALQFLLRLLKFHKLTNTESSWLEITLLDRTTGNNRRGLIFVIASLIKYTGSFSVPIMACELLALLFTLSIRSISNCPSLSGLFGNDTESKDLLTAYLYRLKKEVQAPDLQVAILNFFTVATQAQSGPIIYGGDVFYDLLDRKGKRKSTDATPSDSVIRIILEFLQDWQILLQEKPTLLLAATRFLDVLWESIRKPDHEILQKLRNDSKFWENIASILFADLNTDVPKINDLYLSQDDLVSNSNNMVMQECCHLNIKARVLRILAHEIRFTKSSTTRGSKDLNEVFKETSSGGLRTLFAEIKDANSLIKWLRSFTCIDYDPSIQRSLYEIADNFIPGIKLNRLNVLYWSEDYDMSHSYGDSYMYDVNLARKLMTIREDPEDSDKFLYALCTENHHWSRVDAQVVLLRSWKYFMETASDRLNGALWVSKNNVNVSWPIMKGIAERIEEETRDGHVVMLTVRDDLATLLLRLLEQFSIIDDQPKSERAIQYAELITLLHNGIMSVIFPIRDSVEGRSTPAFHRPLLQSLLLCLRALNNADDFLSSNERILSEFRHTCRSLLSEISALLESLTSRNLNNNSIEEDILTLIAIMEKLIQPLCNPFPTVWLKILEDHHIINLLLRTFTQSMTLPWKDRPIYFDSVTYFLLSLANVPVAAKQLYVDGIMNEFCNNKLSLSLQAGTVVHDSKEDWHQVWCFMLAVVTSILGTIESKERDNFLNNVVGFINLFVNQILHAMACELPLSMPYIEEILRTTMLFYQLSIHFGQLDETSLSRFYEDSLITLLAKINYLFTHPKYTSRMILPMSPEEKEQSETPLSDGMKSAFKKVLPAVDVSSPDSNEMNRFLQNVQQKLLFITRNILATYINITNAQGVLTMSIPIWSEHRVYFEPLMKVSDKEPSTVATLLELMEYGVNLLEIWENSVESRDKIDDWQFWRITWSTTTTFIEMSFILAVSQLTSCFYSEPYKRKDVQDLMTEVSERVVKVQRLVKKLLNLGAKVKTEEIELKSLEVVLRGLQQFSTKTLDSI
ncbi:9639_t:CDS:2 [Acaulospora morrowiae]|uniref:9639_t:CDS:1 n=1 Tax=Acaulospora morrowiae TaxID=94023 RepID=A0A9N8ZFR9_9GLOM|nr:9639_t:CDS:2 [Acaulospora morrowiae]